MLNYWSELTSPQLGALEKEKAVAAVVIGSCEQHARHLPLGTDAILGEALLSEAARRANHPVVLLPTVPYGFSHHHRNFPGAISLAQEVLCKVVEHLFLCASANGFRRLFLLNAHGGNSAALHFALNELGANCGIEVVFARYWDFAKEYIASWRQSGPGGIGHAGEMETSLMMHLRPELVVPHRLNEYQAAEGNEWFHPDMFAPNRVTVFHNFDDYSPDGNVGQPAYATAEKGAALSDYIADQLALFLDGFWEQGSKFADA